MHLRNETLDLHSGKKDRASVHWSITARSVQIKENKQHFKIGFSNSLQQMQQSMLTNDVSPKSEKKKQQPKNQQTQKQTQDVLYELIQIKAMVMKLTDTKRM